jgi:prefoldin subunit 5
MLQQYDWAQVSSVIIQTIVFVGAGYGMVVRNDFAIRGLKDDLKSVQLEIKTLADVLTKLAVQGTRIDNLSDRLNVIDRRVEELRHGQGFVRGLTGIDREYPER